MRRDEIQLDARKIFRTAAEYIRKYGWQVKGMGTYVQPRCSMDALTSAYREQRWDKTLSKLMYETLYKELNGMTLTQYNYKFKSGGKVARLYEMVAEKLNYSKDSSENAA
jgi:hypothetical protein